jgi:hypothetical protein
VFVHTLIIDHRPNHRTIMSSGTPSSLVRSPSQTNHFYSPPNKNRPFFKTEHPGQPQTPPPFTQTLVHSPYNGPHPLPAINGHSAHPQEATQNYQTNTGSPPYQLPRAYSGQLIPAHNLPGTPSSHAHPISRRDSLVRSPVQEHEKELNTGTNGFTGQGNTTPTIGPRSQEVRSRTYYPLPPPKKALGTNLQRRNRSERMTPCPLPASSPSQLPAFERPQWRRWSPRT